MLGDWINGIRVEFHVPGKTSTPPLHSNLLGAVDPISRAFYSFESRVGMPPLFLAVDGRLLGP